MYSNTELFVATLKRLSKLLLPNDTKSANSLTVIGLDEDENIAEDGYAAAK